MTTNKTTKRNYHARIHKKVFFGFAENQNNCINGLGYKLLLQRNSDNHVLSHPAEAKDAANLVSAGRDVMDDISLYVPHYTPSRSNQKLMLGHIVSKAATELS